MVLLKLESENPELSFVIRKNPESKIHFRGIKNGIAKGFYDHNDQKRYIVWFGDKPGESSSGSNDNTYDYLNKLQYVSPILALNLINEYFGTAMKEKQDNDTVHKERLVFNSLMINGAGLRYVGIIQKYYETLCIKTDKIECDVYRMSIDGEATLYELINTGFVLLTIIAVLGDEYYPFNPDNVKKVCRAIRAIDAPYFVRYIFNSRINTSQKVFDEVREVIQESNKHQYKLFPGNTATQRRTAIQEMIGFKRGIVDIGCGEGYYAFPFSKRLKNGLLYHALDVDEAEIEKIRSKLEEKPRDNLRLYTKLDDLIGAIGDGDVDVLYDVIVTEVIEHMGLEDAEKLIKRILDEVPFSRLIVTTPDRDFNKNYQMENEFRHDDHKYELSKQEFKEFVDRVFYGFEYKIITMGDVVDGDSVTQAVVI